MRLVHFFILIPALGLFTLCRCKSDENLDTDPVEEQTEQENTDTIKYESIENAVERYGQLRVEGNQIVDKDGKPVVLRGMSFFWSQWIGKYYTPEAVKWLKDDWRCTVLRAAMAVDYDGYLTHPEQEKAKIKTVIEAAIDNGLYVVIDWHDHEAEKHQKQAKAFFGEMAQLYGDYPNIIYETFNEPLDVSWNDVLKPYHEAIIDTIRTYDPDNLIICGNRTWSQRVDEPAANPIDDENVAYTLHYYASTHKKWLRDRADVALENGIALMVTEYGTTEASGTGFIDVEESEAWWKWMEENHISYMNWSVADKSENSAALKPGASKFGGWPESMITKSGKMVREQLRGKNPPVE